VTSTPTRGETPTSRFPYILTLATAVALAILIGLGMWQVKRLHWKEGLIARIAALQSAPPRGLATALSGPLDSPELDFTRVVADCPDIETTPYLRLYAVRGGAGGYRIITVCRLTSAPFGSILVDRGFVRQEAAAAVRPGVKLSAAIVGVLRKGDKPTFVTPPNDARQNLWYSRDIPAMAKALGAERPAPTYLMLEKPAPAGVGPTPAPIPLDIPNNHLQYAVTWFGLAAALVGVYLASLWRRRSR
jgi:surfeit locus 1 family protein